MVNTIKYRNYPDNGLFKPEYRNNIYELQEHLDDFVYYEKTPIKNIQFDDRHLLSWGYFTKEGLNYLLPRILDSIIESLNELSVTQADFLINLTHDDNIRRLLFTLNYSELNYIRNIVEYILFEQEIHVVNSIGEHYLFLDLEFLDELIKHNNLEINKRISL